MNPVTVFLNLSFPKFDVLKLIFITLLIGIAGAEWYFSVFKFSTIPSVPVNYVNCFKRSVIIIIIIIIKQIFQYAN